MTAAHDLDATALSAWLANRVPEFGGPLYIAKFPGGPSNPTYRVAGGSGALVLRRKPFGPLLPSAHAVEREFRVIAALHPIGFPVPRPVALCSDEAVLVAPFYVMELVDGRVFWDGTLPDLAPAERRSIYEAAIGTLGRLHGVDPPAIGLGDYGRPGIYFGRQIDRSTRQYRAAQTAEIPAVERLIDWLPRTVPDQTRSSLIHGDHRLDNLAVAPTVGDVRAVLDWELSTVGDPLADFTSFAMNWVLPADGRSGLAGEDLPAAGIPSLDEAAGLYCAATGRDGLPDLPWYFAFNLFRLVGILQGVRKRTALGNASSAAAAWGQACRAGAPA